MSPADYKNSIIVAQHGSWELLGANWLSRDGGASYGHKSPNTSRSLMDSSREFTSKRQTRAAALPQYVGLPMCFHCRMNQF